MKSLLRVLLMIGAMFTGTNLLHAQWIQTNGPYGGYVNAFAVSGTRLFAGTSAGVFLSTDNGISWSADSTGLTSRSVFALAVSDTNIFAGSLGGGVWRRPLSEMVTSAERLSTDLPAHFSLDQNYPNPFNPSTPIGYGLPNRSHVTPTVFNTLGQQVALLQDEEQDAGYHEIKFDGSGVSSGLYFYRMQAGAYAETKKLLIVK